MITILNRKEQKYYINNEEYNKLMTKINKYIKPDEYYKEKICNIYFDNSNHELIINSLNQPSYKEKVRLRSYGIPNDNSNVFLEIKKKYHGLVNKRRVILSYKEAKEYIEHRKIPNNSQIMKEIDYLFQYYQLKPMISITYDRESYVSKDDNTFRLTFDHNLKSSTNKIELSELKNEKNSIDGIIMEIKTLKGMPFWLNEILNELYIYPVSFSKYGEIYKQLKESGKNVSEYN